MTVSFPIPGHTKNTLVVNANSGTERYVKFGKYSKQAISILSDFDGILVRMNEEYCYPLSIEFEGISGNVDLSFLDFTDDNIAISTNSAYRFESGTIIRFINCKSFSISKLPKLDKSVWDVTLSLHDSALTNITTNGTSDLDFYSMSDFNSSSPIFTDLNVLSNCNFASFSITQNYFKENANDVIAYKKGKLEYVNNKYCEFFDGLINDRIVKPIKITVSKKSNIFLIDNRSRFRNLRKSNDPDYTYMLSLAFR